MATNKKAVYKVHNGTDFDKIWFETSEAMLTEILQSIADSGYRKLPGGLILQWGKFVTDANMPWNTLGNNFYSIATSISFPIAFPNKCLGASSSCSSGIVTPNIIPQSRLGFNLALNNSYSGATNQGLTIIWIAIGY